MRNPGDSRSGREFAALSADPMCGCTHGKENVDERGARAVASIGSVGDRYDDAMAESVIGLYKRECVRHDGPFRTVDELELATLSWVDWFNHDRLHGELGHLTPIEYEHTMNPQQHPQLGEPS